jgi:hypothetical protein
MKKKKKKANAHFKIGEMVSVLWKGSYYVGRYYGLSTDRTKVGIRFPAHIFIGTGFQTIRGLGEPIWVKESEICEIT